MPVPAEASRGLPPSGWAKTPSFQYSAANWMHSAFPEEGPGLPTFTYPTMEGALITLTALPHEPAGMEMDFNRRVHVEDVYQAFGTKSPVNEEGLTMMHRICGPHGPGSPGGRPEWVDLKDPHFMPLSMLNNRPRFAKVSFVRWIEILDNHRGERPRALQAPSFELVSGSEIQALSLLKNLLHEDDFRRYLRYGFVVVQGASGLDYQIIRGQSHVKVRRRGIKVAELCVNVDRQVGVPPTDSVIARMVLAQYDETDLWKRANIHHKNDPSLVTWGNEQERKPEDLAALAC